MVAQPVSGHRLFRPHSLEEYRAIERVAVDAKHEFCDGEIIAMTGASPAHCDVTLGFALALRSRLARGCRVFATDMRVRTGAERGLLYAYPDVTVACGPLFDWSERPPVLLNPRLIVEVLSDSTAQFDHTEKFERYRGIDGLAHYVLASQDAPVLEHRMRLAGGAWASEIVSAGESLILRALEIAIPVVEIYEDVFGLSER
jgi:Uma2 family endonuclease